MPAPWQIETTKTKTGYRHILIDTRFGFGINLDDTQQPTPPQAMLSQQARLNNRDTILNEE